MRRRTTVWMALGPSLLLALSSAPARAQEASVAPRVGIVLPVGELGRVADAGVVGGLGAGLRVHPRLTLRVDLELENLTGVEVSDPDTGAGGAASAFVLGDVRVWRYTAGVEADVIVPGLVPLTAVVGAGAGGASLRGDGTNGVPEGLGGLADPSTYATARAGLRMGWDFSRRWNAFASLEGAALFTGEASSTEAPPSGLLSGRGTLWAVPVTVGVRVRFY